MSLSDVLREMAAIKSQVQRVADALEKQEDRKKYQAAYYQQRKKTAKAAKIAKEKLSLKRMNPPMHCLGVPRDKELPHAKWAEKLKEFARRGLSPYNFLTWLAWEWNKNTYRHVPITRSGGYYNVIIGMSGEKPLRSKLTERDVTGHVRVNSFTKPEQMDSFASAIWWKWGFNCVTPLLWELVETDEPFWKGLGDAWHRPLQVVQGSFGQYKVNGLVFDPSVRDAELLAKSSKVYGILRPTLEMIWGACLKGLTETEDPCVVAKKPE